MKGEYQLTVPEDNICVLNIVLAIDPEFDAVGLLALVGEFSSGVKLSVLVFGNPHSPCGEFGTAGVEATRRHDQELAGQGVQFVCDRLVGDLVDHVVVSDLEDTSLLDAEICWGGLLNDGGVLDISHSPRVHLWLIRHRNAVLVDDSVVVSIDGRVNTHAEDVLVICGHDARANVGSPRDLGAVFIVNRHG